MISLNRLLRLRVLKNFFGILSSVEEEIASRSIHSKYRPAIIEAIYSAIFITPAILFLDSSVIVSVLIPVTMVAGTAWFSVSLASIKKKFEPFGLELTKNLFSAFIISLTTLFLLTLFSLTKPLWHYYIESLNFSTYWKIGGAFSGISVVGRLLYQIFLGSLKYDINDAMLAGQNEAAEKFFKKALSILYKTADSLKGHRNLQVANYFIGVCFFEIFSQVNLKEEIEKANQLIYKPSMNQVKADQLATYLIKRFLEISKLTEEEKGEKPYKAIKDELDCLTKNTNEDQEMKDIRLSVVFEEMAALMEEKGENIFQNNKYLP